MRAGALRLIPASIAIVTHKLRRLRTAHRVFKKFTHTPRNHTTLLPTRLVLVILKTVAAASQALGRRIYLDRGSCCPTIARRHIDLTQNLEPRGYVRTISTVWMQSE